MTVSICFGEIDIDTYLVHERRKTGRTVCDILRPGVMRALGVEQRNLGESKLRFIGKEG